MLPAFCIAALVRTHSQHYDIKTCVQQDGTIRVDNPKISSTYWVQDTTCTFLLDHHVGTIDKISFTRASSNVTAGTLKLANGTVYHEDLSVHGEGEPFAILPMYKTIQELDDISTGNVTVHVHGKAMVSFGMAEDPKLVFYGVVMDSYEAREWTYGASIYLTFVHVGMFLLTLMSALWIKMDFSKYFKYLFCCLTNTFVGEFFTKRYNNMYHGGLDEGPYTANTALALSAWLDISAAVDVLIWTIWVWARIDNTGGAWFWSIFTARVFFYAYLNYITWEMPLKLDTWEPFGSAWARRWVVPVATGGLLTAHLGYWLYQGRDAMHDASAYYVAVPVIVGLACVVVPCVAGKGQLYTWPVCIGQLALVTFVGIVLNVGLGALAPMCVLFAFDRRLGAPTAEEREKQRIAALKAKGSEEPDEPQTVMQKHVLAAGLIVLSIAVLLTIGFA